MEEKIKKLFEGWIKWAQDEKELETAKHYELHTLIRDELVGETQDLLKEVLDKH